MSVHECELDTSADCGGRNSTYEIVARRREALVVVRHFQPVLIPNSGRYLCVSDLLSPSCHVARLNGMSAPSFTQWWRSETKKQFSKAMRWPYKSLFSTTFCCDFASNLKFCPVCAHLTPETRLEMIYNIQNVSVPAIAFRHTWPLLPHRPYPHSPRPDTIGGRLEILWKDLKSSSGVSIDTTDWRGLKASSCAESGSRSVAEVCEPVDADVPIDGAILWWRTVNPG
jgi:hypothetical protein